MGECFLIGGDTPLKKEGGGKGREREERPAVKYESMII